MDLFSATLFVEAVINKLGCKTRRTHRRVYTTFYLLCLYPSIRTLVTAVAGIS